MSVDSVFVVSEAVASASSGLLCLGVGAGSVGVLSSIFLYVSGKISEKKMQFGAVLSMPAIILFAPAIVAAELGDRPDYVAEVTGWMSEEHELTLDEDTYEASNLLAGQIVVASGEDGTPYTVQLVPVEGNEDGVVVDEEETVQEEFFLLDPETGKEFSQD